MADLKEKMDRYLNEKSGKKIKSTDLDFSYLDKIVTKKINKLSKELKDEIKREDVTGVLSKFDELKKLIEDAEKKMELYSK